MRTSLVFLTASAASVALLTAIALARVGSSPKSAPSSSSDLVGPCLASKVYSYGPRLLLVAWGRMRMSGSP